MRTVSVRIDLRFEKGKVTKSFASRIGWKAGPKEVKVLYAKAEDPFSM